MPNLFPIFLTGLLTGGITCMAVQGGLLATVVANISYKKSLYSVTWVVLAFVGAKIISHTIVGFLLGFFGSLFGFSVYATSLVTIFISFFMIGVGLNMLEVHPIFRHFTITPPKFLRRFIWKESKRQDLFAPFVVGALTVFVPCGTTQAMMAQAIGSGSPLIGAAILFAFTVGTAPLFIILGLTIGVLSKTFQVWFARIAAVLLISMAVINIYFASLVLGIDQPLGQFFHPAVCQIAYCEAASPATAGFTGQKRETSIIRIRQSSYEIENPYINAGDTVALTVKNIDGGGCIQFFTIPSLGIQKSVPVGTEATITFTVPEKKGELPFMCSMGMYRGKFIVQ